MTVPLVAGPESWEVAALGRHVVTLSDVERQFVIQHPGRQTREPIWNDFVAFVDAQRTHGLAIDAFWLDGSFISSKPNPSDIDFTSIVSGTDSNPWGPYESLMDVGPVWKTHTHPIIGRTLMVDAYAVVTLPDGHPGVDQYRVARGQWDDWWQRTVATGPRLVKGYVEVRP